MASDLSEEQKRLENRRSRPSAVEFGARQNIY